MKGKTSKCLRKVNRDAIRTNVLISFIMNPDEATQKLQYLFYINDLTKGNKSALILDQYKGH